MNIPIITKHFKRRNRRGLFAMMRGYRTLRIDNSLPRIMDTQIALVEMPLGISQGKISKFLFGAGTDKANEAIRDFLITRVGQYSLNESLLVSLGNKNGQVVHPLPQIWRQKIRSLGWRVSEIKSALIWQAFLFLCFGYGLFLLVKNLFFGLQSSFCEIPKHVGRYVYFAGLTQSNLPQQHDGNSYDIISWYMQWQGRQIGIQTIGHNVKYVPESQIEAVNIRYTDPCAPLRGLAINFWLFSWGFGAACTGLLDWLRGRWWSPLMFAPCVQAFIAKHQPTYAIDYLFHNSGPRKPLWLYEVEAKGGKSTLYFYSTNSDSFRTREGYQTTPPYYRNIQWNRYLAWDQEQADFVRRCVGNQAKVEIVGPIWYSDSTAIVPELAPRTVAVFDILIRRKYFYARHCEPMEYYIPDIAVPFLNDIYKELASQGWMMAWKKKRKILKSQSMQIDKSYQSTYERLATSPNIITIDPDIAAARLIEKSAMVISMPFTSTALIAKKLGVLSYYYDPSGIIQKGDRAAHGIPIISGVNELRSILTTESSRNKCDPTDFNVKTL